jgi:hypothetical protein
VVVAAVLGGVLVLGGGAAVLASKKSQAEAPTASAAEPPTIKSVFVTERVQAEVEKKTFDLVISAPPEVVVSVDDQQATLAGDKLSLTGTPGATRKVKLTLGDQVQEQTVAFTDGGLMPPRIEMKKAAVAGARPGPGPGPRPGAAAEKPGAAKPADAPKPAKKPQVETGMDEFK